MRFHGIIRDGQVYVAGGVSLPEGTNVDFELHVLDGEHGLKPLNGEPQDLPSGVFPDSLIGCIDDLPADFAERHDYYIHGRDDV